MGEQTYSTKDLKRHLTRKDLMVIAIGQIMGAGILSMTGIAIAMTGRSVPLAFLISALLVIVVSVPLIVLNGSARFRGGQYSMICTLVSPMWGGFFSMILLAGNFSLSVYALSFADYWMALFGFGSRKLIAFLILTALYVLNLFGTDKISKFQRVIVMVLFFALILFTVRGLPHVESQYIGEDFFARGMNGLFTAAALLTFSTTGAFATANLSAEAVHPTRDVPFVIIVSTGAVALLYAVMSIVAAGVLPLPVVANQPLTFVAQRVLSSGEYVYFVVGGALFGLIAPMASQLAWSTKPILQASVDGWFPKGFAKLSKRYNSPVVLLTLLYIIGTIPILAGLDIAAVSSVALIVTQCNNILLALALFGLRRKYPEYWNRSKFKVGEAKLRAIAFGAIFVSLMQIYMLSKELEPWLIVATAAMTLGAIAFSFVRYRSGRIRMEISMEEE